MPLPQHTPSSIELARKLVGASPSPLKPNNTAADNVKTDAEKIKHSLPPSNLHISKIWFGLMAGLITIVIIFSTFIFGWDQSVWHTRFDGKINIPAGQSEIVAEVEFQGKTKKTNTDGHFYFDQIKFGTYPIRVTAKNFKPLNQSIIVGRFGSFSYFSLEYVDTTSIQTTFSTASKTAINKDQLKISIGKQELLLDEKGILVGNNVSIDEKKIEITSPYYVDRSVPISLSPGENILPEIILEPATDVSLQFTSWLYPSKNVSKPQITVLNRTLVSNEEGKILLTDLPLKNDVKISVFAENFNLLETAVSTNIPTQKIALVPTGTVVYGSEKTGKRQLYKAHFDGSNETPLVQNFGDVSWFEQRENEVFFKSDGEKITNPDGIQIPQFFKINVAGGTINRTSRLFNYYNKDKGSVNEQFWPYSNIITQVYQNYFTNTVQLITTNGFGQNPQTIFNVNRPNHTLSIYQNLVSTNGKKVVVVYQEQLNSRQSQPPNPTTTKIILMNIDGTNLKVIEDITSKDFVNFNIIGFTPNSDGILYNINTPKINEVRLSPLDGLNKKSIQNTLPQNGTWTLTKNAFYVISKRDEQANIYALKTDLSGIEEITNQKNIYFYRIDQENNLLFFNTENGNYTLPIDNLKQEPIRTNILTNFVGWLSSYAM